MTQNLPAVDTHLARLRFAEMEQIKPYVQSGARVLELGGGNGFQAAILAAWGCAVTSIDIEASCRWTRQYFPVSPYDGIHLPFPNGSFDVVFSSSVLEHVKALPTLLCETARVLRTSGRAIHVLPTPGWRFWTICTHYPYILKRLLFGQADDVGLALDAVGDVMRRRALTQNVWRAMVPQPHGEFRSSVDELFQYRKENWRRRFAAAGFSLETSFEAGIFYTGNAIAPNVSLRARRSVGRVLGSACRVFILGCHDSASEEVSMDHGTSR